MKIVSAKDIEKLPHLYQVSFAIFCARQVVHLLIDEKVKSAAMRSIEAAEGFVAGKVSREECQTAAAAAHAAAYAAAAHAAAYAAAAAAHAAAEIGRAHV